MKNQYTILRFFWKPEKEEIWLEHMSLDGWHIKKISSFGFYTFEKGNPEQRVYKIDYRNFKNSSDREDYLAMFDDSGWQPVMQHGVNYAFYFYSTQPTVRHDIFSDEASRVQRNLRYVSLMFSSMFPAFIPLLVVYFSGNNHFYNIGYQTPGLWHMTGLQFMMHFLFETPFVILRVSIYALPLIPLLLAVFFILRYYGKYRRVAREEDETRRVV
jgi:hypothetical protein